MRNFTKRERLSKKIAINNLFSEGCSIGLDPFRLVWREDNSQAEVMKVLISIPKKNITLATKRNRIKRRVNEALRLNKEKVYYNLIASKKKLNIGIVYTKKEIQTYNVIEQKINLLLDRLIEQL